MAFTNCYAIFFQNKTHKQIFFIYLNGAAGFSDLLEDAAIKLLFMSNKYGKFVFCNYIANKTFPEHFGKHRPAKRTTNKNSIGVFVDPFAEMFLWIEI